MSSHVNFSMLETKVDSRLLKALNTMGLEHPTIIQAKTLPYSLLGDDIIGAAKTGSGKTIAFLIPAIDKLINLEWDQKQGLGCLIISPTRELARQTYLVLKKLLVNINLTHGLIVGGEKKLKEIESLQRGVNIIVGTPGRILDHLENTSGFNYDRLKCLILDEADKLLEAGFEKHLAGIMRQLPKKRQTLLFSATIDDNVENLARLALKDNPRLISVIDEQQSTVRGLEQGYCICPLDKRICWLYKMLKKTRKMKIMVFFSSCKSVDFHYEFFKVHCNAPVICIHGKQSQSRRKDAYQKFMEAEKGVLFCTNVAARGLDIPSVNWIVQYDPPTDIKEYIHRVGRTARGLYNIGNAVILLRPEEENFVEYLKRERVYLDKYNFGDVPDDVQNMDPMAQVYSLHFWKKGWSHHVAPMLIGHISPEFSKDMLYKDMVSIRCFRSPFLRLLGYTLDLFYDLVLYKLEDLITKDGHMKILSRKAYLSFLRCYNKHSLEEVFNINNLDLKLAAKGFGFSEQPHVDFLKTRKRKNPTMTIS